MQHNNVRHRVLGCVVAGIALVSACGADDDESATAQAGSTTTDSSATSVPPTTTEPPTTTTPPSTTEPPTTTEPPPTTVDEPASTTEPPPTIPTEPVPLRDFSILTAGWPYASTNLRVPVTFTAPDDELLGRWRSLFDTSNYLILTLQQQDKVDPDVEREEPGVSFYVLPDDVTPEQFEDAWTSYAAEQESFSAEITEGEYLGQPATVISGSYVLGEPLQGAFFVRLDGGMSVPTASGERRYLSYLVPVGDDTVVVRLNAHELDWDLNVTLANQIFESLEFL